MRRFGAYLGLAVGITVSAEANVSFPPFYPREGEVFKSAITYTPFTAQMPLPPLKAPRSSFTRRCALPANLGPFTALKYYEVRVRSGVAEIVPGIRTRIWGYDGMYPGPLFRARHKEPAIVRYRNELSETELITHLHGAHTVAQSDGNANVLPERVIPPGESRDFCFANVAPYDRRTGVEQMSDFASTQWYHDHQDMVTSRNVYMGLAGFFLKRDALEEELIARKVLPSDSFDVPILIQDRTLDAQGQLVFKPAEDNHDGFLGDIPVVNGKAQPVFMVQRRKYRFRFLNGSPARIVQLKLSSGSFTQIGSDSWLLPEALTPSASDENGTIENQIRLAPAERADVIVDFRDAPNTVYLINNLLQTEGRKPQGVVDPGTPILKFIVQGQKVAGDVSVRVGTRLRPHQEIRPEEIVQTRVFEFDRRHGHWTINGLDFDPKRVDANPVVGTAERWIFRNGGGGWEHPIHVHLEAHQVRSLKNRALDRQERFKKDTLRLVGGDEAEVFIKFRTFPGRYVFHCHNTDHEDHAMMSRFDVVEEFGLPAARSNTRAITGPNPDFPCLRSELSRRSVD